MLERNTLRDRIGEIAQTADLSERTVRRYVDGRSVSNNSLRRIEKAIEELNIPAQCWVYFARVGCCGRIKIGFSKNPVSRLRQLCLPGPVEVVAALLGGEELESSLHERFSKARVHGEWFTETEEMTDFINDHKGGISLIPTPSPTLLHLPKHLWEKLEKLQEVTQLPIREVARQAMRAGMVELRRLLDEEEAK